MLIVGLLLVVAGIVAIAGLGGVARDRSSSRTSLFGGAGPVIALALGAALVVLPLLLAVGAIGLGGDGDETPDERTAASSPATTQQAPAVDATPTIPTTPVTAPDVDAAEEPTPTTLTVRVAPSGDDFAPPMPVVDDLDDGDVVRVRAEGFEPDADGHVQQCLPSARGNLLCGNFFPVRFDDEGVARFQYEVERELAGSEPCEVRSVCSLEVVGGDRVARARTVFGGEVGEPPTVSVTPVRELADGSEVRVRATGLEPGGSAHVTLCVPPADTALEHCGSPAPVVVMPVGSDGAGEVEYTIETGPVGSERHDCGRGATCGIAVLAPSLVGAPVEIGFAAPPGAAYDTARLAAALAVAAILLAFAWWLVRRTDWSAPTEGDGHEIDDAEYADLDAIIAALPPEPEDELVG